jgi:predicted lactoylglutathione lyase
LEYGRSNQRVTTLERLTKRVIMSTKIFVNLPVKDLNKSMDFFKALGWTFNPQFTDDTAACLVISDAIYVMLLTHKKFGEFTKRKIADGATVEALIAIAVDSKADVDRIAGAAINAGAEEAKPPQDYGFMQLRTFLDLDGHHWEVLYMDPAHAQPKT